jgi:hypothetical protein
MEAHGYRARGALDHLVVSRSAYSEVLAGWPSDATTKWQRCTNRRYVRGVVAAGRIGIHTDKNTVSTTINRIVVLSSGIASTVSCASHWRICGARASRIYSIAISRNSCQGRITRVIARVNASKNRTSGTVNVLGAATASTPLRSARNRAP